MAPGKVLGALGAGSWGCLGWHTDGKLQSPDRQSGAGSQAQAQLLTLPPPPRSPAPVVMGTAAAARLARGSPSSVSTAPGAGGVG